MHLPLLVICPLGWLFMSPRDLMSAYLHASMRYALICPLGSLYHFCRKNIYEAAALDNVCVQNPLLRTSTARSDDFCFFNLTILSKNRSGRGTVEGDLYMLLSYCDSPAILLLLFLLMVLVVSELLAPVPGSVGLVYADAAGYESRLQNVFLMRR